MTLKQYISKTILDLKALGMYGNVEFNLIVSPEWHKDVWEIIVIGTVGEKDSTIASTIKFIISI